MCHGQSQAQVLVARSLTLQDCHLLMQIWLRILSKQNMAAAESTYFSFVVLAGGLLMIV